MDATGLVLVLTGIFIPYMMVITAVVLDDMVLFFILGVVRVHIVRQDQRFGDNKFTTPRFNDGRGHFLLGSAGRDS